MNVMKRFSNIFILTLVIALTVTTLAGCSLYPKEEQMLAPPLVEAPKITYDEATVAKGNIEKKISGQATLISVNQANFFFKFKGGTLKSINVKPGEVVKKGAVIAELDTDNLESRIKQQELSDKESQLTLDDAKYQLAKDQKLNDDAKAIEDKLTDELWQGKPPSDDDKQKATNLQNSIDGVKRSKSAVQRAEFDVEKNKLAMEDLLLERQKSILTSTMDGVVIYMDTLNAGDYANAFKTLVTLADPTQLQIQYTGDNLNLFDLGKIVNLKYKDNSYEGVVVTNPSSMPIGTSKDDKKFVQIKVNDLPKDSEIGDSIDISFSVEKKENVIVLPRNLIHTADGRNYVETLEKGLKVERNIELGLQTATDAEIVKGLNQGEKVIK